MSASLAGRLHEQRLNAVSQMRELLDAADAEKRDLSAEEQVTFDRINNDVDSLDTRIKTLIAAEERMAAGDELTREIRQTEPTPQRTENDEVRDFLRGELVDHRGRPVRSFEVRATQPISGQTLKGISQRALSVGTGNAGGYGVPTSFYDQLVESMVTPSAILKAGPTIINTDSGETIQVPGASAFSTATLVAEAANLTESDPTFTQTLLNAYKYGILLTVSRELIDDNQVNLIDFLGRQAGRALGLGLGAHLVTGSGTNQPQGIVTGASAGVTGATGQVGAPQADDMIKMFYSVIPPYRDSPECAWIMKDATLATIRQFKSSTNFYIWQPSFQLGTPDLLLGKPVYTDPAMPATGLNNKSIVFGDVDAYFVRMVNGIRFERSDDYAFNSDQVVFRALLRADGRLVDQTGAVKYFVGAAS